MKKLLLALGSITVVVAPVATTLSCGAKPVKPKVSATTYAYAKVNELNNLDDIKDYSISILLPRAINPRSQLGFRGVKLFLKGYTHFQASFVDATAYVAGAKTIEQGKYYLEKALEAYDAAVDANEKMKIENDKSISSGIIETEKD